MGENRKVEKMVQGKRQARRGGSGAKNEHWRESTAAHSSSLPPSA